MSRKQIIECEIEQMGWTISLQTAYIASVYNAFAPEPNKHLISTLKDEPPIEKFSYLFDYFDYNVSFFIPTEENLGSSPSIIYQQFKDVCLTLKKILACCMTNAFSHYENEIASILFSQNISILREYYTNFINNDLLFNDPTWNESQKQSILLLKSILEFDLKLCGYCSHTEYLAFILDKYVFKSILFDHEEWTEKEIENWITIRFNERLFNPENPEERKKFVSLYHEKREYMGLMSKEGQAIDKFYMSLDIKD